MQSVRTQTSHLGLHVSRVYVNRRYDESHKYMHVHFFMSSLHKRNECRCKNNAVMTFFLFKFGNN